MNYPVLVLIAALVTASGCASTRPTHVSPMGAQHSVLADAPGEVDLPPEELFVDEPGTTSRAEFPDVAPGTGTFIDMQVASQIPPGTAAAGEVTFNFEGESLHAVIKTILGEILQQNYVIAPGVQGTVTFATAKPLRAEQALSILEMLLRWNNATLVWQDGRYTILPIDQAVPGNLTPRSGPVSNARGFEVRAVPLQFISALEMEKVLKPYAKPNAVINVDPARNMIVLGGTRAELQNYLQTVQTFDVDWLAGMSVGMFSLQQAEAAKVVTELEKIFGEGSSTPLAGMFRFMPLEGINGVLVITPQKKYLNTIQEWLERFDLGSGEAGTRLYVYDVKNVKASELAATLGDVFGGSSGGGGDRSGGSVAPGLDPVRINSFGGSGRVGGLSNNERRSRQRAGDGGVGGADGSGAGGLRSGGDSSGSGGAGGVSLTLSDDVRLSSVEESNALIVRATPAQWESIRRVIERLDVVPLQVVIEAQIISVQLNDSLNYGVRWYFENAIAGGLGDAAQELAGLRNSWTDISGQIVEASTSWAFVGPNMGALVTLLDEVTSLKVLSAPSLVVLNNKSASINSGASVPVSTTSINLGQGGTSQPINSTQYLQTGITLTVTPRVNPGGLVFLEIDQEDSTPGTPAVEGGNPPISQSNITTEVAVQSGETVLLGGLIKQSDSTGSAGFPGLSRLPIIGGLFGNKTRGVSRQELIVLITPKVIRNSDEARRITEDYKQQFKALEPLHRP